MKLVVIIPAHNEAATIAQVISSIPNKIDGIQQIETLVMDDGSTDGTAKIVQALKIPVFRNITKKGLAETFKIGMWEALRKGADIIINIDADMQYDPKELPRLIQPILRGKADLVSGDRQVQKLTHMKFGNKYGNLLGSNVLSFLVGRRVNDASSGFRAYSRAAALKLNIFSKHTYVHETLIEAVYKNLRIQEVPVTFMVRKGESRLISGLFSHMRKSLETILFTVLKHKALKIFFSVGFLSLFIGIFIGIRFLYFFMQGQGTGHVQSLILAAILSIVGFQFIIMGMQSVLINANLELSEEILYRLKQHEK